MARRNDQKQTRVETVSRHLAFEIVTGKHSPGSRLDEMEVAARLGVSRTPVREAFARLAVLGLVDSTPRRGAVVCPGGPLALKQMLEEMEVIAVRTLTARRCDLSASIDGVIWPLLHQAHGNPVMSRIAGNLWQPFLDIHALQSANETLALCHDAVLMDSEARLRQAVGAGNLAEAEAATRTHLRLFLSRLLGG